MKTNQFIHFAMMAIIATFGVMAFAAPPLDTKTVNPPKTVNAAACCQNYVQPTNVPACCQHNAQAGNAVVCPVHGRNCPHHLNAAGVCTAQGGMCGHTMAAQTPTRHRHWWCLWMW